MKNTCPCHPNKACKCRILEISDIPDSPAFEITFMKKIHTHPSPDHGECACKNKKKIEKNI